MNVILWNKLLLLNHSLQIPCLFFCFLKYSIIYSTFARSSSNVCLDSCLKETFGLSYPLCRFARLSWLSASLFSEWMIVSPVNPSLIRLSNVWQSLKKKKHQVIKVLIRQIPKSIKMLVFKFYRLIKFSYYLFWSYIIYLWCFWLELTQCAYIHSLYGDLEILLCIFRLWYSLLTKNQNISKTIVFIQSNH